jgi:hypothetical protein
MAVIKHEHIASFRITSINDRSAVVETVLLIGADACKTFRMRLLVGESINLSFDATLSGDKVLKIEPETRRELMRMLKA